MSSLKYLQKPNNWEHANCHAGEYFFHIVVNKWEKIHKYW